MKMKYFQELYFMVSTSLIQGQLQKVRKSLYYTEFSPDDVMILQDLKTVGHMNWCQDK